MKKGLTRRLFTCVFTFLLSTLSFSSAFAAGNPFELTNLSIADKSSTVEGTAGLNANGEIENNVVFHAVGDWVKYLLELKNTSSEELTISSIADNNSSSYITYSYSDHTGEVIAAGASLQLEVTATYANAVTDLNARAQSAAMKISIGYTTPSGTAGDASIMVPNTGDSTEGGASASAGIIVAFAVVSVAAAIIAVVLIRRKNNTSSLFVFVLAFAFVFTSLSIAGASASEALSSELEFDGSFSLFDKLAINYTVNGTTISQPIAYGAKLSELETPIREGYSFARWYDTNENYVDGSTVITSDLNLVPEWNIKYSTLSAGCQYCGGDYFAPGNGGLQYAERKFWYKTVKDHFGLSTSGKVADVFTRAAEKPSDDFLTNEAWNIATNASTYPVYLWYDEDDNALYWWSEAGEVRLPYYSKYAFYWFPVKKMDLTGFSAVDARYIDGLFEYSKITEIVFGESFNSKNVYSMSQLFYGLSGLTKVDLENLDTSNVSDFSFMFNDVRSMTTLDISTFNMQYAYNMEYMFSGMKALTSITLPAIDISQANLKNMFDGVESLVTLDMSSMTMADDYSCPSVEDMFKNAKNLVTIFADPSLNRYPENDCEWIESGDPSENPDYVRDFKIFSGADKLVGGNGSSYPVVRPKGTYDNGYDTIYYYPADEQTLFRIDGYNNRPGMFTAKP